MYKLLISALFLTMTFVVYEKPVFSKSMNRGYQIFKEADRRSSGFKSNSADAVMILKNSENQTSERQMHIKSLEGNISDKTLIVFNSPEDVKGTSLLTHVYDNSPNDQWLYLPVLKRVKRITSSTQSGPFMGSEFTYEDMVSHVLDKYNYKYLKDQKYRNMDCFVVAQYPKDRDSGYSKQIIWMDKKHYRIHKVDLYDKKEKLVKKLEVSNYKQYKNKYWRAKKSQMKNIQTGKETTIIWKDFDFNTTFSDSDFNKNTLDR